MIEEWKDIAGYEGLYQIANTGRVRRLPSMVTRTANFRGVIKTVTQTVPAKEVGHPDHLGYKMVSLCKGGKVKIRYVHVLVMETFVGPRPKGYHTCHNDGDVTNARLDNLRYDTVAGNAADRYKHGTDNLGVKNPQAKLTEATVRLIREDLKTTMILKDIGKKYGVSRQIVSDIKHGRRWSHVK